MQPGTTVWRRNLTIGRRHSPWRTGEGCHCVSNPYRSGKCNWQDHEAIYLLSLGLSFPSVNKNKYSDVCSSGDIGLIKCPEVP